MLHLRRHAVGVKVVALLAVSALVAPAGLSQTTACEPATAEAELNINNVRARIFGNGPLFWRGSPNTYEVPTGGGVNAIFSASLWLGGMVDGELRAAAARYGRYEFWPGPLEPDGKPPGDCAPFDRLWTVARSDWEDFERTGNATIDISEWPTGLGAPTLDADGRPIPLMTGTIAERAARVINLDAGERPDFHGDQMVWWIMNDVAGTHDETETHPIGVEVRATAFGFNGESHISNATFYDYEVQYRGASALEEAYAGLFVDSDLGNFADDYVGSDSILGIGFTYNSDNFDDGRDGYGDAPPAVGYGFFPGPVVVAPGDTAWVGNRRVPGYRNLKMTAAINYYGGGLYGDPGIGIEYYNYLQGKWENGEPLRVGNRGFDGTGPVTRFVFHGDPVAGEYWSEMNADGMGGRTSPADRRMVVSSGPFRILPDSTQTFSLAIAWARGASHLESVTRLKQATSTIAAATQAGFVRAPAVDPPVVTASSYPNGAALTWSNPLPSNNYQDSYSEFDAFASDNYRFEGYNVFQYRSANDTTGNLIAVYDRKNEVGTVIEGRAGEEQLTVAGGKNTGVRHFHVIRDLDNYRTYHFGVQTYVHQPKLYPRIRKSTVARVVVEPGYSDSHPTDSALVRWPAWETPDFVVDVRPRTRFRIEGDIADPNAITGDRYTLVPDPTSCSAGRFRCTSVEVVRGDGEPVASLKLTPEQVEAPLVFDGLEFRISVDAETYFSDFLAVQNATGSIEPPSYAAFAFNSSGFPHPTTSDRPDGSQQANGSTWGLHSGQGQVAYGPVDHPSSFLGDVTNQGQLLDAIGASDFEIRFTASGGHAWRPNDGDDVIVVPFELWNIGAGTPTDPSDDYRMIPAICEAACGHAGVTGVFDIAGDHDISGGSNDPFTDWITWYAPTVDTPGEVGYEAFFGGDPTALGEMVLRNVVLVNWNGGVDPGPYDADLPEAGSVFRIYTTKGFGLDDGYVFDTDGFGAREKSADDLASELEDIGIVPNPYHGAADYETTVAQREVRMTNVPNGATVRVFTLNGTLIRELRQEGEGVLRWDLRNRAGYLIGNGMYLIHVDVPDVGSRVLKFGAYHRRVVSG